MMVHSRQIIIWPFNIKPLGQILNLISILTYLAIQYKALDLISNLTLFKLLNIELWTRSMARFGLDLQIGQTIELSPQIIVINFCRFKSKKFKSKKLPRKESCHQSPTLNVKPLGPLSRIETSIELK